MSSVYSVYEAKAKFSEILRRVREGQTVTISYHGEEVAEIRPLHSDETLAASLQRLSDKGVIQHTESALSLTPLARRPGALNRFLGSRD